MDNLYLMLIKSGIALYENLVAAANSEFVFIDKDHDKEVKLPNFV